MNVAIIQSSFIPWRGYFDIINDADLFVFYDDVQYTSRDWRNRNRLKIHQGTVWLTVPVLHEKRSQLIQETRIDYSGRWIQKTKNLLIQNYRRSPYFEKYIQDLLKILDRKFETISELNVALTHWIMRELGIQTETQMSRDFYPVGLKTDRLLDILKKVGATSYLSGPSAKDYLELEKFREARIGLAYKVYSYREYPQLHGPFEPNLSVVDLLFNCGPDSRNYIKSLKKNEEVLS